MEQRAEKREQAVKFFPLPQAHQDPREITAEVHTSLCKGTTRLSPQKVFSTAMAGVVIYGTVVDLQQPDIIK